MNTLTLDRTDIKILNELQKDANLTNVELAGRINLSPSPCLTRVKKLEQMGIIERRVTLLNPKAMGLEINAYIQVTLDKQPQSALENFRDAVERIPEVMECNWMTGDCDFLLRVILRNVEDLEHLITSKLSKIEGVATIRSNLVLKQITYKTALPIGTSHTIIVRL
ncbi:Lrp/AsnC family transcriptional regulator [Tistrella mobilis]|uniref:ArsR family transcriptional regulator n=1 Tax=Tistrella mobilis TaxID=171437 RepID=A0A162L273_9PROT|nr:Lrp/AsnC family transcriptional regulator [Tistrella mobilis]KYO52900.1 ArsR family transcriptional regulator [Tistrella mobilis]